MCRSLMERISASRGAGTVAGGVFGDENGLDVGPLCQVGDHRTELGRIIRMDKEDLHGQQANCHLAPLPVKRIDKP